jgi:hypothetical protein
MDQSAIGCAERRAREVRARRSRLIIRDPTSEADVELALCRVAEALDWVNEARIRKERVERWVAELRERAP